MKTNEKGLSFLFIAILSISASFGFFSNLVNAQLNSYTVDGSIGGNGAVWHNIFNVKQNELVLVSVAGSNWFSSSLYYPNQTEYSHGVGSRQHVYQFNASSSGTYLLRLDSYQGYAITYSGSSSHEINNASLMTPYIIDGSIGGNGAVWHNIFNVKQNELVLVSVAGSNWFSSSLYYPNQTEYSHGVGSRQHVYQFNASSSGTYLLRLDSYQGYAITYSASSSHTFENNTLPRTAVVGDPVPFEVPSKYVSNNSNVNYIWDFGDGTITPTNDTTTAHTYKESGNFTITLKIQNDSGENIIQTYFITINPKENTWIIQTLITISTGAVAVAVFGWVRHIIIERRKRKDLEKALPQI